MYFKYITFQEFFPSPLFEKHAGNQQELSFTIQENIYILTTVSNLENKLVIIYNEFP